MLEKLRSRHPIDVPAESWGRSKILFLVLGGIAGLFLMLPLALSAYAAARYFLLAVVAAGATLVVVLVVSAARGKPGHARR